MFCYYFFLKNNTTLGILTVPVGGLITTDLSFVVYGIALFFIDWNAVAEQSLRELEKEKKEIESCEEEREALVSRKAI